MDQPADTEKDRLNTGSGLRAHLIVRFLSSVLAASRVSTVSTELCTRIVRRLHCEPLRNAMRNPSATVKSTSNGPVNRRLACLIQRIAAIRKLQLYNALNPRIDPVSLPPRPPDRREFRYVRPVWPQKSPAVRLSRH